MDTKNDLEKQEDGASFHPEAEETLQRSSNDNEKEQPSNIVDFDGNDDPANPLNWTIGKKWTTGGLVSFLTLITPLASSMFSPGVAEVMQDFHRSVDPILTPFTVSIYVLGYAFGPLILAPLSELYGRLMLYHVSNILFTLFMVCCALSTNVGMLLAFRFLGGAVGSTPLTIGGGTVADLFRTEERGAAMALWSVGPLLGPVIGPVAGGFLIEAKGWRWVFWLLAIVAGAITITGFLVMEETYAPRILDKKTKRLQKETGDLTLRSKYTSDLAVSEIFKRAIFRPMKMLFLSPIVLLLSLYMAIIYGYLYLLFTTIPGVFEGKYGFSEGIVGLAYLGIGVGMFMGLIAFGIASDIILKKLTAKHGETKPEFRMPPMIPGAFMIPIGLFIYGWTANFAVHWIVPILGSGLLGIGILFVFMSISTYLVDCFELFAASAMAANTVLRSVLGALLPLAGPSMYSALGLGWGTSLLGFIAVAMTPLPFVFWAFGERIRKSKIFNVTF